MSFFENNLRFQILFPITVIMTVVVIVLSLTIPQFVQNTVEKRVSYSAIKSLDQFKVLRDYYTENIVKKVQASEGVTVGMDHLNDVNKIPLPATMIHDLSELFSSSGSTLTLYSEHPFPNRKNRQLDEFQKQAWQTFQQQPDKIIQQLHSVNDRTLLRIAISDRMQVQACVDCHNSHPLTPKNDWQLGDVRGALEISTDITSQLALAKTISAWIILGIVIATVLLIIIFYYLTGKITKQVSTVSYAMNRLGEGDYATEVAHQSGTLEVKQMSSAFDEFKRALLARDKLEKQQQLFESEKIDSLGRMVASVAHDVATPLGIGVTAASFLADELKSFEKLISSGAVSKKQLKSFLSSCDSSLILLSRNITAAAELIHSFKQVSVDQISEESRTIVLSEYLEEIVQSLRPKIRKSGVTLTIDVINDCHFSTYPGALSQVMTNLIINSLIHGYIGRKGGNITISLDGSADGNIEIIYCDDGIGIDQKLLSKVMEPFFTTRREQGGSGLGLSIVHSIVTQKLKGTIKLSSAVDQGVRFDIIFPIKPE